MIDTREFRRMILGYPLVAPEIEKLKADIEADKKKAVEEACLLLRQEKKAIKLRTLTADEVSFRIEIEFEDLPVEDAIDSGDAAFDKKVCDEIYKRLSKGDTWAWCEVSITARYKNFTGVVRMGACSYESEQDFMKDDYYSDMKMGALKALNQDIADVAESISGLIE